MNIMRANWAQKGILMEDNKIIITDELMKNISIDKMANLKVQIDNLINRLDNIEEVCNKALNL